MGYVNSPNKLTADIYTFIYVISVPGGLPRGYGEIEKRRSEIKILKNEKCKSATTTVSSE